MTQPRTEPITRRSSTSCAPGRDGSTRARARRPRRAASALHAARAGARKRAELAAGARDDAIPAARHAGIDTQHRTDVIWVDSTLRSPPVAALSTPLQLVDSTLRSLPVAALSSPWIEHGFDARRFSL